MDERKPGRSVVVRLDGEGVNWLYKPISFVPGVKVEYGIAVAVTGDRDFIQVVQRIKDTGKRVEIAHFSHIESKQGSGLLHYGDRYWKLDSLDIFMD